MTCTFFGGVFLPVQSGPVVGAESAKDLDETEGGSAVLEAPRPPNSLLSISAGVSPSGLRFPPTFRGGVGGGGEPAQGRKNTTKQHRAAGQCVCVSHVARLWIPRGAHACVRIRVCCVCVLCMIIAESVSCTYLCVCVCVPMCT